MTVASRPLVGWRILVTRPAEQIPPFAAALESAGAIAVPHPTIAVLPAPSWNALDQALAAITDYQWAIFTSPSAVRFTLGRAGEKGVSLAALQIAAVGTETARALEAAGIKVDVLPAFDQQRQEGLAAALALLPAGTRVLFPQAIGGRDFLVESLGRQGCAVEVVAVSRTVALALGGAPPAFDVATFASPSAFRAFVDGHGAAALQGRVVAAIGPTTAAAIAAAGVGVDVVSEAPSATAMVSALIAFRQRTDAGKV
ncbi:MAG TPA: uroporphyrinogen-III synthase [Polyangia bacterium]|nr:uroporphyrinogen-III synthase [Polyangia bacterium]